MFTINFATFIDDTLCASYHPIYELVWGNDLWFILKQGNGYILVNNRQQITRSSPDLFQLLDLFKTFVATNESPFIQCVFDNAQTLIEATRHAAFGGVVNGVRILTVPQDSYKLNSDQEPVKVTQLLSLADYSVASIEHVVEYGSIKTIRSSWSHQVDPLGVIYNEPYAPYHEERQYLRLLRKIIATGVYTSPANERTGTGTLSVFGEQMRFSLRNNRFPVLTTKKVFYKGVVAELLWMLKGQTDAKLLAAQGVNIWNGNTTRDFLDKRGLSHLPEGDIGQMYGFNWRHWGAEYKTCHDNYDGQGIDQLANIINEIKTNPGSRRMVLTAWNVSTIDKGCLPPCHFSATFTVKNGELSCSLKLRSSDCVHGYPFNLSFYALLTILMAECTGLRPGEIVTVSDDAHIYATHIELVLTQITRSPYALPTMRVINHKTDMDNWEKDDFVLENYQHHSALSAPMAI